MKKPILRGFTVFFATIMVLWSLTGCASINLTGQEQQLLDIQEQTSQKIQELSQKITAAAGNYEGLSEMADEVSAFIDENIKKLRTLTKDMEGSSIVTQTKAILETGKLITAKVGELTGQIGVLSEQVKTLADDTQKEVSQKIDELKKNLEGLNARLEDMKKKFEAIKTQLFDEVKQKQ